MGHTVESYSDPVVLEPDDNDTILVTVPDFPEAITFGEDEADALRHAAEVIEGAIEGRILDNKDITPPSPRRGRHTVTLPVLIADKVALYRTMRQTGVRKAELARRLGWHRPRVARLLDINDSSRIDHLERALAVLGKRLALHLRDVA